MKIWNYMFIFSTLIIILEFLAIPTGLTSTLSNFGVTLNPSTETVNADLSNSPYYLLIIATLLASTAGAIIVGFFTKTFDTRLATLPVITTVFVLFISTTWAVISYVNSLGEFWAIAIVTTIFVPLGIGYALSMVDYFNGYQ